VIGHCIRVLLVGVTGPANATSERDSGALLDHVRGLVCGGVQVWLAAKRDVLARGVRLGTDALASLTGRVSLVCLHAGEIVVGSETRLDALEVR
jgi:hypothetical protein